MKRIIVDVLLMLFMLMEYSKAYLTPEIHEIIGLCLIVLIIIHLILNRRYFKAILKGKFNKKRIFDVIVNIVFLASFILTCVFGILSSQEILTFLNIKNISIIYLHKILAYICIIFLGFHLGITLKKFFKKIEKTIWKYVIYLAIIICGIYSCIKIDFYSHLIGKTGFSLVSGNILINSLEYLSIILMIAVIVNIIYSHIS